MVASGAASESIQVPDKTWQTLCIGDTCGASAENEESCSKAVKERHFNICGDICISESICMKECEKEVEKVKSSSVKLNKCNTFNGSTMPGAPNGGCITSCLTIPK